MNTGQLSTVPAQTMRHGDIEGLVMLLQSQQLHKVDAVVPLSSLIFSGGNLAVAGLDPVLDEEFGTGFIDLSGLYRPAGPVDDQLSSLLDIPVRYIKKLRNENKGLLDINLNELADTEDEGKKVLIRLLFGTDSNHPGTSGVVRAILSDKYRVYDNLDTVLSVLAGMHEAGLGPEAIQRVDLSDNRLYIHVSAPGVEVMAREMMKGYRSPFIDRPGEELPLVRAGIVFTNSEVGSGAFKITPEAVFLRCMNGWTIEADKFRKIHLGSKLEEGRIDWSDETRANANALVKSQVKDAVATFLSKEYLESVVAELEKDAGVELESPEQTIKVVAKELMYTKAEADSILSMFVKGGQMTSGGIGQAVTAASQLIEDVDRAYDFNSSAIRAMKLAAKIG